MLLLAICLSISVRSQDVITMKSGDEIKAKVMEVNTDNVTYKKFDNINGPTYTAAKGDIFMIKYENGSKDVFNAPQYTPTQPVPAPTNTGTYSSAPAQNSQQLNNNARTNVNDGEYRALIAKSKKLRRTGGALLGTGLVCLVGGVVMVADALSTVDTEVSYVDPYTGPVYDNTLPNALAYSGGVLLGYGLVGLIYGSVDLANAHKMKKKAQQALQSLSIAPTLYHGNFNSENSILTSAAIRGGGLSLRLKF